MHERVSQGNRALGAFTSLARFYQQVLAAVAGWSPERTARLLGVDESKVPALFAAALRALICQMAPGHHHPPEARHQRRRSLMQCNR